MAYDVSGEKLEDRRARGRDILKKLGKAYPGAHIALNYANSFELLVAVILSAQCTDVMVNKVTSVLFPKYRKKRFKIQDLRFKNKKIVDEMQQIVNVAEVPIEELEQDVRQTGFYKNKAKNVKTAARMILDEFDGKVPDTMEAILKLPGVARKTANVVLGNAYGVYEGIAVDTHVLRISQRLRLLDLGKIGKGKERMFERDGKEVIDFIKGANADKIEAQLMEVIPKKDWFRFTYNIIDHGRAICDARKPKCSECPISDLCPSSRV